MGDTMQAWLIVQFLLVICLGSAQLSSVAQADEGQRDGQGPVRPRICIK